MGGEGLTMKNKLALCACLLIMAAAFVNVSKADLITVTKAELRTDLNQAGKKTTLQTLGDPVYAPVLTYSEYMKESDSQKARLIELKEETNYYYDIDHDDEEEKINIKVTKSYQKDREAEIEVYVNDEKTFILGGYYICTPYIFSCNDRAVLIYHPVHGDGGMEHYALPYVDGKYEKYDLDLGYGLHEDIEASEDTLVMTSFPKGWWWYHSFNEGNDDYEPFGSISTYFLRENGELCSVGSYPVMDRLITCKAMKGFSTGKTISDIPSGNGPKVKKGDVVTVKHYDKKEKVGNYWEIEVNGERGWFRDSIDCPLKIKKYEK